MYKTVSQICAFMLLKGMPLTAALIVDGYSPESNDRFTNDPAFIAGGFNLSAIARSPSNRWGTLVSPNLVLSANHAYPGNGSSLVFFETNNPLGSSDERMVIGSVRIGSSDLRLCVLKSSLPAPYEPLPIANEAVPDAGSFESSSLNGLPVFMVGRSNDIDSAVTNMAFGRNLLERWFDAVEAAGTLDDALGAIQHFPEDEEFVPYEAYLQIWDSGAPLLADLEGTLTIIGINWFVGQVDIHPSPTQGIRNLSGFSYVGNYAPQIQAVIHAFSMDATAGYLSWMSGAFGGESDWALTGPAIDFDRDGLVNLLEYAFVRDPLNGAQATAGIPVLVDSEGGRHLGISFMAREDPDLLYAVKIGSDLSGWTQVPLSFNGSSWISSDPDLVVVSSTANAGGGVWDLIVRAAAPLESGAGVFISLFAQ